MATPPDFPLYDILAVTHGLPSNALQYRTILAHITGVPVEQMTGAGMAALTVGPVCKAWVLQQHPQLLDVPPKPDFGGDEAAMDAWAADQAARIGTDRLPVAPLPGEPRRVSLGDVLDVIAEFRGGLDTAYVVDPEEDK